MMATVPHVTSGSGLRKFQADGFFWTECTNAIILQTYFVILHRKLHN